MPVSGLHLDEDDRDAGTPLGMTVGNLGPRADAGNEDEPRDDILSVAIRLENAHGRFCIFGSAEQLRAFAAELDAAVTSHLDAEHAEALGNVDAPDLVRAEAAAGPGGDDQP